MATNSWNLKLLGDFELRNRDGDLVRLSTRKVEALLAILALSPGQSLTRAELQEELWPGVALEKQQASLRQAIAQLRKAIHEEVLISTRERCRLADSFDLTCDALQFEQGLLSSETHQEFMPDAREPWFEKRRGRYQGDSSAVAETLPGAGLLSLMEWYSHHDPVKALELLRDHRDIVNGITPKDLQPVVERLIWKIPSEHPLIGWAVFFRGLCVFTTLNISGGEAILQQAIALAMAHDDKALVGEIGTHLTATQILSGRLQTAGHTVEKLVQTAARTKSKRMGSRAKYAMGLLLAHQGQPLQGLELLEEARSEPGVSAMEAVRIQALQALFAATSGLSNRASQLLVQPQKVVLETSDSNLEEIVQLTSALIALKENEHDRAIQLFENLISLSVRRKTAHVEIYGREGLALATWRRKERADTADQLKSSGKLRRDLKMQITDWDRARLDELVK